MSGDLKVVYGQLDLAATDLTTAARHLASLVSDLEAGLDRHQQAWTGAAKDAYLPAKAQWNGAIDAMQVLLHDLGVAVDRSNQAYLRADLQGSRLFG